MIVAIWDEAPVELFASAVAERDPGAPLSIERHTRSECLSLLMNGQVDVALLSTLDVLQHTDELDVFPAVAYSTWANPYTRIILNSGFESPVQRLVVSDRFELEGWVARIVLSEHYGSVPERIEVGTPTESSLQDQKADAVLIVGNDVPGTRTDRITMDLGQEWYELANYPMVWGLFAAKKGRATKDMIQVLRDTIRKADEGREAWVEAQNLPEEIASFYLQDVRVRFDDLAVASLTELRQYLFYEDVLDEIPDLPLVAYEDDEDDDNKDVPLL